MSDGITITKEGEKKLKKLEELRNAELDKIKEKHEGKLKELTTDVSEESRLKKLKVWGKTPSGDTDDPRYWALVNVNSLQNFVKYGANKVMDQIRVRTHANIMAREEVARAKEDAKKQGFDVQSFAYALIILLVAAAIAMIMIGNFFNYKTVQDENMVLSQNYGTVSGKLAACENELWALKPGQPAPPSSGGETPPNVLEG